MSGLFDGWSLQALATILPNMVFAGERPVQRPLPIIDKRWTSEFGHGEQSDDGNGMTNLLARNPPELWMVLSSALDVCSVVDSLLRILPLVRGPRR
mmetsp:Transcript_58918/g.192217  ORF Transcript_58918/g.192217 Transcript_58918/m.192217 type:complete len:96 (-) Transcript_58918:1156-1443(-)